MNTNDSRKRVIKYPKDERWEKIERNRVAEVSRVVP